MCSQKTNDSLIFLINLFRFAEQTTFKIEIFTKTKLINVIVFFFLCSPVAKLMAALRMGYCDRAHESKTDREQIHSCAEAMDAFRGVCSIEMCTRAVHTHRDRKRKRRRRRRNKEKQIKRFDLIFSSVLRSNVIN